MSVSPGLAQESREVWDCALPRGIARRPSEAPGAVCARASPKISRCLGAACFPRASPRGLARLGGGILPGRWPLRRAARGGGTTAAPWLQRRPQTPGSPERPRPAERWRCLRGTGRLRSEPVTQGQSPLLAAARLLLPEGAAPCASGLRSSVSFPLPFPTLLPAGPVSLHSSERWW